MFKPRRSQIPTQTFDTPSLIGRRWLPWPSSARSECLTVSSSISSPLKSETTFLNRWVQVVSVGGGCEAQSGQQWVGGRCEGWTCNLQQLPAGSETEVHQGLVYSTAGKKRRIWSCLMVLPVITEGWPVEGPAGTHIVPAVEFEPSRQADL